MKINLGSIEKIIQGARRSGLNFEGSLEAEAQKCNVRNKLDRHVYQRVVTMFYIHHVHVNIPIHYSLYPDILIQSLQIMELLEFKI